MNGETALNSWSGFSYYDKFAVLYLYPHIDLLGNINSSSTSTYAEMTGEIFFPQNTTLECQLAFRSNSSDYFCTAFFGNQYITLTSSDIRTVSTTVNGLDKFILNVSGRSTQYPGAEARLVIQKINGRPVSGQTGYSDLNVYLP